MKERILLFIIIAGLTVFIYIFQNYTEWGLGILLCLMALYFICSTIATKVKARRELKSPKIKDESYKPFVTIMIPAHNEEYTIESTVRSRGNMEYDLDGEKNFEIIVVNDGHDAGSTAMMRGSFLPRSLSLINGAISPPKLEPPPAQPMMISGYSSNISIAFSHSSPMMD